MTQYNLVKHDGTDYYVENLKDVWNASGEVLLRVRYEEGDCDTITENDENMHRALYDLYQTNDNIKEGDTFAIDNVPVYKCVGVHVVPV